MHLLQKPCCIPAKLFRSSVRSSCQTHPTRTQETMTMTMILTMLPFYDLSIVAAGYQISNQFWQNHEEHVTGKNEQGPSLRWSRKSQALTLAPLCQVQAALHPLLPLTATLMSMLYCRNPHLIDRGGTDGTLYNIFFSHHQSLAPVAVAFIVLRSLTKTCKLFRQ